VTEETGFEEARTRPLEPLDKNLNRLMEIQQETDKIIRSYYHRF